MRRSPGRADRGQHGVVTYLSLDDASKLETVMLAPRRGDVAEAAEHGRVFELKPIAAE